MKLLSIRSPGHWFATGLIALLATLGSAIILQAQEVELDTSAAAALRRLQDPNASQAVRIKAWEQLALSKDTPAYPAMVAALPQYRSAREAAAGVKAVVKVGEMMPNVDQRVEPVLEALRQAKGEAKLPLLTVLGQYSGRTALSTVREHLQDAESSVRELATDLLSQWPDTSAAEDLLRLAREAPENTRSLALKGFVRLALVARSAQWTMFKQAASVAKTKEDKLVVLESLAELPEPESLRLALGMMNDESVQTEAARAVITIVSRLPRSEFAQARYALDRVAKEAHDEEVKRQAQALLGSPKARVLMVTGQDYPGHPWRETAPLLKSLLEKDPRLEVRVVEDPSFLDSEMLMSYDVVVLHFMNWEQPAPGLRARQNLSNRIRQGGGLVLVHFACGAFQDWPEFVKLAGRVWDPKLRGHDPHGTFEVVSAKPDHPIMKGLGTFATTDELYTCLAGDTPIEVLATARSKVDGKDYPMAFVLEYGKGKVFHSPLGHDPKAFAAPQVGELFRRGCAWAAGLEPSIQEAMPERAE